MKSLIADKIGIKYPIIQGGMAWIAEHNLAAAVSNAGGLGIIAAGNAPSEKVREEIRMAKKLTDKPFGVNIMLLSDNCDEVAKIVCEEGVRVVTTGAGNPQKYMSLWKENDVIVIPVVPSVALAKRMEKYGADAVIVEGCEAGGHIGELTTMVLVPQVVDEVNIPVIAAGGVGDGRAIAAVKMLGADAVQMGTRFLVSKECIVHDNYKQRIISAKDRDTVVTARSTGHPVRALRNNLTRTYSKLETKGALPEELQHLGMGALAKAVVDGDIHNGSVMAGQIAGIVKKEQTAQEIIDELIKEVKECFKWVK